MSGRKCLLVLDMLRDFVEPDGKLYCGPSVRKVLPLLKRLIEEFRRRGDPVVYIYEAQTKNDPEF